MCTLCTPGMPLYAKKGLVCAGRGRINADTFFFVVVVGRILIQIIFMDTHSAKKGEIHFAAESFLFWVEGEE